VEGQRYAPAAFHRGRADTKRTGGWAGRYGRERKILLPPGYDPRTVQPVPTELYRPPNMPLCTKQTVLSEQCLTTWQKMWAEALVEACTADVTNDTVQEATFVNLLAPRYSCRTYGDHPSRFRGADGKTGLKCGFQKIGLNIRQTARRTLCIKSKRQHGLGTRCTTTWHC
jgi:hypothetical protein